MTPGFKQDDSFRYHGRDLAVLRGRCHDAVVLLGSATPSVTSSYHARTGKYALLPMTKRVGEQGPAHGDHRRSEPERSRRGKRPVQAGTSTGPGGKPGKWPAERAAPQPAGLFLGHALPGLRRAGAVQPLPCLLDPAQGQETADLPLLRLIRSIIG